MCIRDRFGIEQKDANGDKVDMTTPAAAITNSTAVMMTSVAGDPNAIGYISLGSLDDTVKAVSIDGVAPTAACLLYTSCERCRARAKTLLTILAALVLAPLTVVVGMGIPGNGYYLSGTLIVLYLSLIHIYGQRGIVAMLKRVLRLTIK